MNDEDLDVFRWYLLNMHSILSSEAAALQLLW